MVGRRRAGLGAESVERVGKKNGMVRLPGTAHGKDGVVEDLKEVGENGGRWPGLGIGIRAAEIGENESFPRSQDGEEKRVAVCFSPGRITSGRFPRERMPLGPVVAGRKFVIV